MSKKNQTKVLHWADQTALRVIKEKGDKKLYTIASGITPSGVVHIGNFREIITVELVKRALESLGKKVRFIYSWDDYDVFRKVPKGMPGQEKLATNLRKPIVDVFDPYKNEESYARRNEVAVEKSVPRVGINPEYIYQSKEYRKGTYTKQIKFALDHTKEIIEILNKFRSEPLSDNWLPIGIFSEKFGTDEIKNVEYDGEYGLSYTLIDGTVEQVDFRKSKNVKLKWRVDWPMRWAFEQVDFEPGGKDHSTVGGSFDTGKIISKKVWDFDAPIYIMYDFVRIKGGAGKMSSSSGNVVTLTDVLDIYEPEIVRWFFASTRASTEFAISFDADVIKYYEDFDKCERIYFGLEEVSDKEKQKQSRIYELSCVDEVPQKMPFQPSFRHLTMVLQIHSGDVSKTVSYYDKELKTKLDRKRVEKRAVCAKNWLEKYAPEEFVFTLQEKVAKNVKLSEGEKSCLHAVSALLREGKEDIHKEFKVICEKHDVSIRDFFRSAYNVLINKDKGPRLTNFIEQIGKEKVAKLFESV